MVQKLRQKFKTCMESKKDDKGFTLVELIVVIVILAILIGVTIGGVFGYVNKSRINTDINNAAAIQSACATLATNSTVAGDKGKNVTIAWNSSIDATNIDETASIITSGKGATISSTDSKNYQDATKIEISKKLKEMLTDGLPASKSGATFKLEIKTDSNGNVTVKCRAYNGSDELQAQE